MKIRTEHKYIGAALIQIAEHSQFTAINAMKIKDTFVNNAFKINNNIGVFCKYASEPNVNGEYIFTFLADHVLAIESIGKHNEHVFLALICIEDSEICCLSLNDFNTLLDARKKSAGKSEDQYQILITASQGNSLRAYMNASGKKGKTASKPLVISRKAFPDQIFG
ncbi:MAG: hypothetical protein WC810_27295 [Janthinobacterium sp.]